MNYRSIADLNRSVKSLIPKLPRDLDLIVGIPRSGLLVANLLSLYLNLPLTDVDGFCEGRILATGRRWGKQNVSDLLKQRLVALVVDDSLNSGAQMKEVKAKIEAARLPHRVYYAAIYVSPEGPQHLDYWCEIVENPRVWEWNVMHHPVLANSCVDIDGVLCRNPTPQENDDGEEYRRFLADVEPLIVPSKPIGWLVTCRLEKYRELTRGMAEKARDMLWSADHGRLAEQRRPRCLKRTW